MGKIEKYIATIDEEFVNEEEETGISRISFTATPAIKLKGYAFSEQKKMMFSDDKKMRIAAPVLVPMDIYRGADEDDPEHYISFTKDEIEKIQLKLMEDLRNTDLFNVDHTEEIVPAYLLEVWQVEDPKNDKSFKKYGLSVPEGSLFAVVQVKDKAYYEQLVESGKTGFSIEGYFGRKLQMNEQTKEEINMKLPEGKHEIDGKIYVIGADGEVVEILEKEAMAEETPEEVEMETEEKKTEEVEAEKEEEEKVEMADEKEEEKKEELAEEIVEDEVPEAINKEAIDSMIDAKLEPLFEQIAELKNMLNDKSEDESNEGKKVEMSEDLNPRQKQVATAYALAESFERHRQ